MPLYLSIDAHHLQSKYHWMLGLHLFHFCFVLRQQRRHRFSPHCFLQDHPFPQPMFVIALVLFCQRV